MCAFSAVLTTPAHSPEQPAVVSDLSLHERSRRAHLHHQCSTTTSDTIFYIAPSSCVRGAQISASFHHHSRRDNPSSDTTRATTKKISFNPTSRRSSHAHAVPAGLNSQRPAEHLARWHRFSALTGRRRVRAYAAEVAGWRSLLRRGWSGLRMPGCRCVDRGRRPLRRGG